VPAAGASTVPCGGGGRSRLIEGTSAQDAIAEMARRFQIPGHSASMRAPGTVAEHNRTEILLRPGPMN